MTDSKFLHPSVKWAQRKDKLFLTISLSDCSDPQIKLDGEKLHFSGKGGPDQKDYKMELEFFKEVKPEESKQHVTQREIIFKIKKKNEEEPYWPRLQKEKKKPHFLMTDFAKWKDEDDSDGGEFGDESNFEDMMSQMAGANTGQGQAMTPEPDSDDSDDDGLPDLE